MGKSVSKQFIAKTGIDFEGLNPPARVEAGDPIPDDLESTQIEDLLALDAIEEVE